MNYFKGDKEYFKGIGQIEFEGAESDNPLAFKFYDKNKIIVGKTMKEHLHFAFAYQHSFNANGSNPFGASTMDFPFNHPNPKTNDIQKADAAFEFITKLDIQFYCFHDSYVSHFGEKVDEYQNNLHQMARELKLRQAATGVKLLWNTTKAMLEILKNGGLHTGGLNFDAKRRRNSTNLEDLFFAHILGVNSFARGLEIADKIIKDEKIDKFVSNIYSSFDSGKGKNFENGKMDLEELASFGNRDLKLESGKQEYLESLFNGYMFS